MEIQNVSDLEGRRIGVGYILDATSYQLGYQLLAENMIHILEDAEQFVLYGTDFERQFQDVLSGRIDAGVASSTWLAEMHAGELDRIRVIQPLEPWYEGEPFPFPTSTPLVPQSGLAVSPLIPWQLKHEVARALQRVTADHPAAVAAKIEGFTGPGSYAGVQTTQKAMRIIITPEVGVSRCSNQWSVQEIWESFDCSSIPGDTFVKLSLQDSLAKCALRGDPCPDGLVCFCKPCVVSPGTNFFNWPLVLALCATIYGVGLIFVFFLRPTIDPAGIIGAIPAAKARRARREM